MVPVAQRALNTAYRESHLVLVFGHEPGTPFATLAANEGDGQMVETLDPARVQSQMDELVSAQEQPHQERLERVRANRLWIRASASNGTLPNLVVAEYVMEYVMVARVGASKASRTSLRENVDGTL